jgi:hypothetical protein
VSERGGERKDQGRTVARSTRTFLVVFLAAGFLALDAAFFLGAAFFLVVFLAAGFLVVFLAAGFLVAVFCNVRGEK